MHHCPTLNLQRGRQNNFVLQTKIEFSNMLPSLTLKEQNFFNTAVDATRGELSKS